MNRPSLFPNVFPAGNASSPSVDLSGYARAEDLADMASQESVDLLRSQTQASFDGIYTREEADARYYTHKQSEDRFMPIDQAFSKIDFDNHMALSLYSRQQVDDKLAAISPLGANSINDPALAGFRKSMLDAVALMLAGGTKQPPPDIGWTKCGTHVSEVRLVAGMLEFRGVCSMSTGSNNGNLFSYPATFPLPENACSYPVAARLVGSAVVAAYVNYSTTSRVVSITAAGSINEYTLTGLRVKAAY